MKSTLNLIICELKLTVILSFTVDWNKNSLVSSYNCERIIDQPLASKSNINKLILCLTAYNTVVAAFSCTRSVSGDLYLHRSNLISCISRTNAAGGVFWDLQRPVPRVFPGDVVCVGIQ